MKKIILLSAFIAGCLCSEAQVPAAGLVAYYPMNGNAGDSSGHGNNATVYSGASLTTDRNNTTNSAYYFNGATSAYLWAPSSSSLNMSAMNGITYAFWFKADSTPSTSPNYRVLFQLLDSSVRAYDFYYYYAIKKLKIGNYTGSVATIVESNNTYNYNTWYHVTVVSDSTNTTKLYVNGVLDTSFSLTLSKPVNAQLYIGENGVNHWNFQGKLDEVRIYNRALSPAEVSQLYAPSFVNTYYSKAAGPLDSLSTWGTNTNGTGTIPPTFSQNNTAYIVKNNSSPAIGSNWIITGTNTAVVFGDGTNALNTSIPSGIMFGADSIYVRNNATFTVLGTLITNKPGFENGSTVQYTGAGAQTLQTASYSNLVVSGGAKTLASNITVRGTLAMIANINCNGNTLTLGSGTTQTGTLTYGSGIVTGNFARWYAASTNSGTTGLFPIGTSSQYRPLQIEYTGAPSSGGVLTATFTGTNPGSSGLNPALNDFTVAPIVSVNKAGTNGYWTLAASNGISGGTYTATCTATGFYGISNISGLRLLRRNNSLSGWSLSGSAVTPTGTTSIPVISRTGITSSGGDFGIGADSTVNALPVTLISFEAALVNKKEILLSWETAQEINNDYFEIERSENNIDWTLIGRIKGNGTTSTTSDYQYTDGDFFQSYRPNNKVLFYRLKQTGFDGGINYSNAVTVNIINGITIETEVYPNPTTGNFVVDNTLSQTVTITFTITNMLGEKVWSMNYPLQQGKNKTEITNAPLLPGLYFLRMEDETKQFTEVRKLVVK